MSARVLTRGAAIVALAAGILLAAPAVASAQTDPRPVLDSAPAEIPYRATAVVSGHMEDGTGGEQITLQKYKDGSWRDLETQSVDENSEVQYRLEELTGTAEYRLVWTSPEGREIDSERHARIRVAARVKLAVGRRDVMSGRRVRVKGWVLPATPGREVVLKQRVHGNWRRIARVSVQDGQFSDSFRVRSKGRRPLRAVFGGDDRNTGSIGRSFVKVYSRSLATWYGPGFYGNRTACGQRLNHGTLGVAHRRLPCGTDVSILYEGRTITVPVIDRGPYSSADWDLTEETADRLRFSGKDTIGTNR